MKTMIPICKATKHKCYRCGITYHVFEGTPTSCPVHYVEGGQFNLDEYTDADHRELSELRDRYVGKRISVHDGLIIVIEVLDKKHIEFILLPHHKIYVAPLSYITTLHQKS